MRIAKWVFLLAGFSGVLMIAPPAAVGYIRYCLFHQAVRRRPGQLHVCTKKTVSTNVISPQQPSPLRAVRVFFCGIQSRNATFRIALDWPSVFIKT